MEVFLLFLSVFFIMIGFSNNIKSKFIIIKGLNSKVM